MGKKQAKPARSESEIPTHNTHNCPKCGAEQRICHTGLCDVPHTHKCPNPDCGQVWQHKPDDVGYGPDGFSL